MTTLLTARQAWQLVLRFGAGLGRGSTDTDRGEQEKGTEKERASTRLPEENMFPSSPPSLSFFLKAAVPFSSTFKWLPGKQSKGEWKG